MGGGEINVAYEGTFGDLGPAGDASLFAMDEYNFMGADGFTAVNGAPHGATVSPQDVFNNDSFPPSTSFTNLTTPGSTYLQTPDEDYQTSPLFDSLDYNSQGADTWFPLFSPDADAGAQTPAPVMARTTSASSANQIVVHPGDQNRKRNSSSAMSPNMATFSPALKHSNVAGVNARRKDKPLMPIVVDAEDTVALKRARNTSAARKSRAKKVQERDDMEAKIVALEEEVAHWKNLALSKMTTDEMAEA